MLTVSVSNVSVVTFFFCPHAVMPAAIIIITANVLVNLRFIIVPLFNTIVFFMSFDTINAFVINIPHFNHNLPITAIYFVIMNMKGRFLCDESD